MTISSTATAALVETLAGDCEAARRAALRQHVVGPAHRGAGGVELVEHLGGPATEARQGRSEGGSCCCCCCCWSAATGGPCCCCCWSAATAVTAAAASRRGARRRTMAPIATRAALIGIYAGPRGYIAMIWVL